MLVQLFLTGNLLTGTIPPQILTQKLNFLWLQQNQLTGTVPALLGSMPQLSYLALGENQFSGTIPSQLGKLSKTLNYLSLNSNLLVGKIPTEIGTCKSLSILYLYGNQLDSKIPTELGGLPKLQHLHLMNNKLIGSIPTQLGKLVEILQLLIGANFLTGTLPTELGRLGKMNVFYTHDNTFTGTIPLEYGKLSALQTVLFATNQLTGTIPTEFGRLTRLTGLHLYDNRLDGIIPTQFGRLTSLQVLQAMKNHFTGKIPTQLGKLTMLQQLQLNENELTGTIPTQIGKMTSLVAISLAKNKLSGSIPMHIGSLARLGTLSLSGNDLGGTIPSSIGNGCPDLTVLQLDNNKLTGSIPPEFVRLRRLSQLQLQVNQLEGTIPGLGNLQFLTVLFLFQNKLTGPIPTEIGRLKELKSLYLGDNHLRGPIPTQLGKLEKLNLLHLLTCSLVGSIPVQLAQLVELTLLALQNNELTGTVPKEFKSLVRLRSFTVQNNYLDPAPVPKLNSEIAFTYLPQSCYEDRQCLVTRAQSRCENATKKCACNPGFQALQQSDKDNVTCVDVDECTTGLWGAKPSLTGKPCLSQEVCINTYGAFTCCPPGWKRDPADASRCSDIDECITGLWSVQPSSNTNAPCRSQDACVNLVGTFSCCPTGYTRDEINQTSCRDIDECSTGLWSQQNSANTGRPCASQDMCINFNGTFECCAAGYTRSLANITTCVDLDECATGLWSQRNSNNGTGPPCLSQDTCLNFPGTFQCCPPGYLRDTTNPLACADIDECTTGDNGRPSQNTNNTCSLVTRYEYCKNIPGSYLCLNCNDIAVREENTNMSRYIKSLASQDMLFEYRTCFGFCSAAIHIISYSSDAAAYSCNGARVDVAAVFCQYPCLNQTTLRSADAAVNALSIEFARPVNGSKNTASFLEDVMLKMFNATVKMSSSKKRNDALEFTITPCRTQKIQAMQSLIQSIAQEIVPNAPSLQTTISDRCAVSIQSTDPNSTGLIVGSLVGAAAAIILLIIILVLLYIYVWGNELKHLPEEVAWSYQQYKKNPLGWRYRGSSEAGYYYKHLDHGSLFYSRAMKLFTSFPGGDTFEILAISAVYNPVLVRNFIGSYRIAQSRATTKEFSSRKWSFEGGDPILKSFVNSEFGKLCAKYSWNQNSGAPIIPALHGTDALIAEKICENGFAALSSLDAGFFGKGIYFTTYPLYTIPYIATRNQPALILSWVIPGNIYPVTEDHRGPKSLLGTAMKSGYSSHYALTTKDGHCCPKKLNVGEYYDELVISQEAQITPTLVFHVESKNLASIFMSFNRVIPSAGRKVGGGDTALVTPLVTDSLIGTDSTSIQSLDD